MLGVFEDEVDTLLLKHNFAQSGDVLVRDLAVDLREPRSAKGNETNAGPPTMISLHALCDIPVYVTTSPSLSGLNFLIATSSPSSSPSSRLSFSLLPGVAADGVPRRPAGEASEVCWRTRALYTRP